MTAPFAAIEAATAAGAFAALANAEATIGAALVAGIFDNGYQAGLLGAIESARPSFTCASADVSTAVQGTAITINAVAYKVAEVQPDGTGVTVLVLERAA